MKPDTVNRIRPILRLLPPRMGEAITYVFARTFKHPRVMEWGYLYQKLRCRTCGYAFYVYKEHDPSDWPDCLSDRCASYDPARDPFGVVEGPDGPTLLDRE